MSLKNFIVAIVLAIAVSAGIFVATRWQAPADLNTAFVLPAAMPLPEFSLVDQAGNVVTRDSFRDRWDLVFFGFTHCPDICPATLQILALARNELAAAGQEPLPRIVLVSVDPERDTPELMGKYVDYFGDGNLGVTGNLDETRKLTSGLGIYFEKQAGESDDYAVDHSAAVLLINPDGEFHALFGGPHTVENFVHDVPLIMEGR
ncbi:MAG: SCO family protein [Gammaproteobacteria bacterium]|nr:SCO family protein [Gammaproteobacteria bacterium]MBT8111466.1 SCO family protein [Gammaproteobacteria bacterium]NND46653.1 SCO family protein [Woeseiaceae bacterium]NNL46164.1 SCO family protein [Woeseiaceae bacterium]